MGVNNLACYTVNLAVAETYADIYDVECKADDWVPFSNYLWIARSGCDLPFKVQCQLNELYESINTEVPSQTSTTVCGISVTVEPDISATSCTSGIVIRTIQ